MKTSFVYSGTVESRVMQGHEVTVLGSRWEQFWRKLFRRLPRKVWVGPSIELDRPAPAGIPVIALYEIDIDKS